MVWLKASSYFTVDFEQLCLQEPRPMGVMNRTGGIIVDRLLGGVFDHLADRFDGVVKGKQQKKNHKNPTRVTVPKRKKSC